MQARQEGENYSSSLFFGVVARYDCVRIVLAVVLLAAATAKGFQLANDVVPETRFWNSRPFLNALVLVELGFGLWLIAGLYATWTWTATLLLFLAFFEFNVYQVTRGEPVCPCLGRLEFSPVLMLTLDLLAILVSLACRPAIGNGATFESAPLRLYGFPVIYGLLAFPALLAMVHYSPAGIIPELRRDSRLHVTLQAELKNPRPEEVLAELEKGTGLTMTIAEGLSAKAPVLGYWKLGKASAVMEGLAQRQSIRARWEKVAGGYSLVQAAPWGNRLLPWLVSLVAFTVLLFFLGIKYISEPRNSLTTWSRQSNKRPVLSRRA